MQDTHRSILFDRHCNFCLEINIYAFKNPYLVVLVKLNYSFLNAAYTNIYPQISMLFLRLGFCAYCILY